MQDRVVAFLEIELDSVLERLLPPEIASDIGARVGRVGGASVRGEYLEQIEKAEFREVSVVREVNLSSAYTFDEPGGCDCGPEVGAESGDLRAFLANVTSVHIQATK